MRKVRKTKYHIYIYIYIYIHIYISTDSPVAYNISFCSHRRVHRNDLGQNRHRETHFEHFCADAQTLARIAPRICLHMPGVEIYDREKEARTVSYRGGGNPDPGSDA